MRALVLFGEHNTRFSLHHCLQRLGSTGAAQSWLGHCGLVTRFLIELILHCHFRFQNWDLFSPSFLKKPPQIQHLNYSQPSIYVKEQQEIIYQALGPTNPSRLFLSRLIANDMLPNVKMQPGPVREKSSCLQGTL